MNCPFCSIEIEINFDGLMPDDWAITHPFPPDCGRYQGGGSECVGKTHHQLSEVMWWDECPHCGTDFWVKTIWSEPCNGHGSIERIVVTEKSEEGAV